MARGAAVLVAMGLTALPARSASTVPRIDPPSEALQRVQATPTATRSYVNQRFGFSLQYPPVFTQQDPLPADGSGARFATANGSAWFLAYGRRHPPGPSLAEVLREEEALFQEPGATVTYRRRGESWFVLSGTREATPGGERRIFYYRVVVSRDATVTNVLRIDYPFARKLAFDDAVTLMSRSFRGGRPGPGPASEAVAQDGGPRR